MVVISPQNIVCNAAFYQLCLLFGKASLQMHITYFDLKLQFRSICRTGGQFCVLSLRPVTLLLEAVRGWVEGFVGSFDGQYPCCCIR